MTEPLHADEQDPADGRDAAADDRDEAADERDLAAAQRDDAGDLRDEAAGLRDLASGWRDLVAARRDAAADARDREAAHREQVADGHQSLTLGHAAAQHRAAAARRHAAADRQRSSQDRDAGADARLEAGQDRTTAQTDRESGATQRGQSERDRDTALADRDASAQDRDDASLDSLTGAYVRGPGLLQLEREVLRARRSEEPLTVGFVDVDGLKAVNDAGGHAAGDRLLARVAAVLRQRLRPYDLVVRYGGDEFVCVLPGLTIEDAEQRFELVNRDLAGYGSVSFGVATAVTDELPVELVARADAALYRRRDAQRQV